MNTPAEFRYTREHHWISLAGQVATVGITDFAQEQLGEVVFIELPAVGRNLQAGEQFGLVESVKTVSDLTAPLTGQVVEVNAALETQPELVNLSPHSAGWILRLKVPNSAEYEDLLDDLVYQECISQV